VPDPRVAYNFDRVRVLLVEPHAAGMKILSQLFRGIGVRDPVRVNSVAEAMKALDAPFDLIVCDARLDHSDAYDLVLRLRRSINNPNRMAIVVVISGHTPLAKVAKARDCGANYILTKPVIPRKVMERLIWLSNHDRDFIISETYCGPDRRFHALGPPPGVRGRRAEDRGEVADNGMELDEEFFVQPRRLS
jgi:CheY-like chemotaxis protein